MNESVVFYPMLYISRFIGQQIKNDDASETSWNKVELVDSFSDRYDVRFRFILYKV